MIIRRFGILAAMDPTGIIGINGTLPWHSKADFKRFKALTTGCHLVMGSKTYASLPKQLPGRTTIVLSHNMEGPLFPGDSRVSQLKDALLLAAKQSTAETIWIAGGAQVYRLALEANYVDYVDFIDLTIVPKVEVPPGSVVTEFPVDLLASWRLMGSEPNADDPTLIHRLYEKNP